MHLQRGVQKRLTINFVTVCLYAVLLIMTPEMYLCCIECNQLKTVNYLPLISFGVLNKCGSGDHVECLHNIMDLIQGGKKVDAIDAQASAGEGESSLVQPATPPSAQQRDMRPVIEVVTGANLQVQSNIW